jgi:hypothetical protein
MIVVPGHFATRLEFSKEIYEDPILHIELYPREHRDRTKFMLNEDTCTSDNQTFNQCEIHSSSE